MKHGDYKAVITLKNRDGKELGEFTTWRDDIIMGIANETLMSLDGDAKETMTIVIKPNNKRKQNGSKK